MENQDASASMFAQIAQINKQRIATYGLLSRLYIKEVDQVLLEKLKAMRFPTKTGNKDIDSGYSLIASYLSNVWENTQLELAVDFARVFIGHGTDAFSAAYPFESVYTSEKRLLMQGARDEILAIYRGYGIDKKDTWKEGEDHIALELEFVHILAQRLNTAIEGGNLKEAESLLASQKGFLTGHLAAWSPMMTADMKRFAKTDFYRGLAMVTDGFLATDRAFLKGLLDEEE